MLLFGGWSREPPRHLWQLPTATWSLPEAFGRAFGSLPEASGPIFLWEPKTEFCTTLTHIAYKRGVSHTSGAHGHMAQPRLMFSTHLGCGVVVVEGLAQGLFPNCG